MIAAADTEGEILADLAAFFRTEDRGGRAALAARIEAHPAYDRALLRQWLDRLDLWPELPPGRRELAVPVGCGEVRRVELRVPRRTSQGSQGSRGSQGSAGSAGRPARGWPLLYLLHPGGSSGPGFLPYIERLLGPGVEEFVVAAPTGYRQTGLDAPAPFTTDHRSILEAVRRTVHVDAGRTYALGYSTGGYAAWAVALFHADELAGAVAIGSVFTVPPGEDGLWKEVLPNFARVPVLHVWGARDTMPVVGFGGFGGGRAAGTMAAFNERFRQAIRGMELPVEDCRIAGRGHGGMETPRAALAALLARRRDGYPRRVDHTFRHLFQSRCYWLEAQSWEGASWGAGPPRIERRRGESEAQAMGRTVRELLGRLHGEVDGQTLRVERRHVGELTVWVGEEMIDWSRPVAVEMAGERVFEGSLRPDLLVCLTEAARGFDFERLRWAGVRVAAGDSPRCAPVTGETPFPALLGGGGPRAESPRGAAGGAGRGRPKRGWRGRGGRPFG